MKPRQVVFAAALASAMVGAIAPKAGAADLQPPLLHHRYRHVRSHYYPERFVFSYNHNYGPVEFWTDGVLATPDRVIRPIGAQPYAWYDVNLPYCAQSSANYRGQDGRRHPCN